MTAQSVGPGNNDYRRLHPCLGNIVCDIPGPGKNSPRLPTPVDIALLIVKIGGALQITVIIAVRICHRRTGKERILQLLKLILSEINGSIREIVCGVALHHHDRHTRDTQKRGHNDKNSKEDLQQRVCLLVCRKIQASCFSFLSQPSHTGDRIVFTTYWISTLPVELTVTAFVSPVEFVKVTLPVGEASPRV